MQNPARPPRVSIVINNYNYASYLPRAIESALAQSWEATEVVVVDDGSTDASPAIVRGYGDAIVAVLGSNRGQGAAYNAGFAASTGDLVIFLDSDDLLYPDAAARLAAAWRPGIAKVQFPLDVVDAAERPLGYRVPNMAYEPGSALRCLLAYGYYPAPPGSGNAFARDALEQILPLDEATWRVGSDGAVIALAALYGEVVDIGAPLGAYRQHDRNHSEMSGTSLAKIRRDLCNEVNREAAIRAHAARLGIAVGDGLSRAIPGHVKGRLLSLRLDGARHPFAGDGVLALARDGVRASFRFPHYTGAKRLAAAAAFTALPLLPRRWLARRLEALIVARRRGRLLRRLLPELAHTDDAAATDGTAPRKVAPLRPAPVRSRGNS